MCVCVRERERERECVCVCVCVRERERDSKKPVLFACLDDYDDDDDDDDDEYFPRLHRSVNVQSGAEKKKNLVIFEIYLLSMFEH